MARPEHHALPIGRGAAQPLPRPRAGVDDRLGPDLDRATARLAVDRRAGRTLHEAEDVVEGASVLQAGEAELLVGIVVEEQLRVPAHVVQRMGGPAGDEPGEQGSFDLVTIDGTRGPRGTIEPRQTADVGFDNVGRHRPGSLTRGTGWTCGTRTSW